MLMVSKGPIEYGCFVASHTSQLSFDAYCGAFARVLVWSLVWPPQIARPRQRIPCCAPIRNTSSSAFGNRPYARYKHEMIDRCRLEANTKSVIPNAGAHRDADHQRFLKRIIKPIQRMGGQAGSTAVHMSVLKPGAGRYSRRATIKMLAPRFQKVPSTLTHDTGSWTFSLV